MSHALRNVDSTRLEQKPRMADFAVWATAAEESFGLKRGVFISAFMGNRENANELALEASPIAATLVDFIQQQGRWTGKPSELLEELNRCASEETRRQQGWPKRSNTLSGAIKRIAPNLRTVGISHEVGRTKSGRFLMLEYKSKTSSSSSPSSSSTDTAANITAVGDGLGDGA